LTRDEHSVDAVVLRLPPQVRACLFDLDGVLTDTAELHAAAWKEMFDAFLRSCSRERSEPFAPFDPGRARADGVRTFLAARGITLAEGDPADPPSADTVHGLGNRKNALVLALIASRGVQPYEGSVRYVRCARKAGLACAVVSASKNCRDVLLAAGIDDLFEVVVDGIVAEQKGLRGKPAPDTFLTAASMLAARPAEAAVFEDALAGVAAGRAGGFGFVVGVDRVGQADALGANGADVVVSDLAELLDRG
jgi:beta-phosphoglucomutase family hydrolase